ncbi:MAG: TetR/AcrR family transcriptional regulator, partial [Anaerolineae bacterium]|nr:TetR/AcrR family transcriptional regulator [Anaerolineae bacterium]
VDVKRFAMTNSSRPKRAYNSTRRQAQARQTRQNIVDAARRLFSQRGYSGATIEAIAQESGVAPETIYAVFGNKRAILAHLLNIAVGGDDAAIPILERPGPQVVMKENDPHQQLRMFARDMADIMERAAPVFEIMRVAAKAEPEISALLQNMLQERWRTMEVVFQRFGAKGSLRQDLTSMQGADIIWTMTSAEIYLLLTVDRGWSKEQYIEWLAESLIRLLMP